MNNEISIEEANEFNEFLGESKLRSNFAPLLFHIKKLNPKSFDVNEFGDNQGKTSAVQSIVNIENDEYPITLRVCYNIGSKTPEEILYEFWWSDENYCCVYSVKAAKNLLTILIKNMRLSPDDFKKVRRGEMDIPYE